jgi:CRP-like cAMP-binding protein
LRREPDVENLIPLKGQSMSTIEARREQMFPKLDPREIDRLRRLGPSGATRAGEAIFVTGEIAPGMVVLMKGSVQVTRRDPLGRSAPIVQQGPGEFVAEVGQLSRPTRIHRCPCGQRCPGAADSAREICAR